MLSLSESIFTRVLNNSDKLRRSLNTFADFKPAKDSETTTELDRLIKLTKLADKQVKTTLSNYTEIIDARHKVFYQTPTSLEKRYIIITSAVRRQYGAESPVFLEIYTLIADLRQIRRPHREPANPSETHYKQTKPIYDSLIKGFEAIINKMESFEEPYKTAYDLATIDFLRILHQDMISSCTAVETAIQDYQAAIDLRDEKFEQLKCTSIAIKETARRQYVMDDERYKFIKTIKFEY